MPLPETERRKAPRIPLNAEIVFSYFSAQDRKECSARVVDHNAEGLQFETGHPIEIGAGIFIRAIDEGMCSDALTCLRTATLAEVKWRRADSGGLAYRAGVKYR